MADRRNIIVPLVIITFIFLSPDPVRTPPGRFDLRPTLDDVIAEEQRSLAVLQNSTYYEQRLTKSDAPLLNLTGLDPKKGFSWSPLPQVQGKARKWLEHAGVESIDDALNLRMKDAPLFKNVTGFVHGTWVRSKLEGDIVPPKVNISEYAPETPFGAMIPRDFGRNITGDGGDIRLQFFERQSTHSSIIEPETENATRLEAEMTISEGSTEQDYELRVRGVYFPNIGQAVLTTTSDKFAGIFLLPHLAMSAKMFEESRNVLNGSITKTVQRQIDGEIDRLNPWSADAEGAVDSPLAMPKCEMVVYLQQLPPVLPYVDQRGAVLALLENELRFPTGAFLPPVPDIHFAMTAFSPDCGFVIESRGPPDYVPQDGNHLVGAKVEVLHNNSRHHLLLFTLILALQLYLLMRQMREASTPSTRSRISFYTIAMLSLGDGFTTMTFLLISLFVGAVWINLVGTSFLAFISVSFFGMRFLMDIWTVQAPERAQQLREELEEDRRREERFQAALQRIREQRAAAAAAAAESGPTAPPTANPANTEGTEQQAVGVPANTTSDTQNTTLDQPITSTPQETASEQANTTSDTQNATADQPISNTLQQTASEQTPPGSLPLPVTAQRPNDTGATPVIMPSNGDGLGPVTQPTNTAEAIAPQIQNRESFGALYTKFYLLLLGTLFLSLNATSWPSSLRRGFFTTLALIYLSFWYPQIKRNVHRNCRHALDWEFVIGQSVLRLVPFAYFYGYKHNVLFADVDFSSLALLIIWVWIQVVLLGSQELIGPRWFIRKGWAPPAYDYHPVLREDEEGATMPIGFSQVTAETGSAPTSPVTDRRGSEPAGDKSDSPIARRGSTATKESKEKGKRVFDCAICMQDLEVPVIEAGASADSGVNGPAGLLARRMYMVTPCRHIFHSACLEGWMKYRLQCPICREDLPPL